MKRFDESFNPRLVIRVGDTTHNAIWLDWALANVEEFGFKRIKAMGERLRAGKLVKLDGGRCTVAVHFHDRMKHRDPSNNGFKIAKDVYKRGAGRWAKVMRQHVADGQPINGVQYYNHYYSVAKGFLGQAIAGTVHHYDTRAQAIRAAEDWINA